MKHIFLLLLALFSLYASAQSDSTKQITVTKIFIEGNHKTKPKIITRELSFREGGTYTKSDLDSMFVWDGNRIYNTNLFNKVDLEIVNEQPGGLAEVRILVDERWYFYPIPIFRLIDRNFNDWWVNRNRDLSRVNYGIRVSQFNFRGRGELLRVNLQTGFTDNVIIEYNIPYIDRKQRHGLYINSSYIQGKAVAYTSVDNVRRFASSETQLLRQLYANTIVHSYRSSFYSFHRATLGHYRVDVVDTLVDLNPNYLGDSRTQQQHFWFGYSYSWDKRNNINYPTSGEWYRGGLFKHGLGIHDDGVDYWRMRLALTKYWDLGKKFYAVTDGRLVSTFPERRDFFNYYSIGFMQNILRGHDTYIIEASTYLMQRNEIKRELFGKNYNIKKVMPIRQFQTFPVTVFGKLFFDQGYARSYPDYDGSDLLTDRYLYSYGVGLDFLLIYDVAIRFEYSRNTLGETNFFLNFLSLF